VLCHGLHVVTRISGVRLAAALTLAREIQSCFRRINACSPQSQQKPSILDLGAIRGQLQRTLKVRRIKTHYPWQFFHINCIAPIGFAATENECAQCKGNRLGLGKVLAPLSLRRLVRQMSSPRQPDKERAVAWRVATRELPSSRRQPDGTVPSCAENSRPWRPGVKSSRFSQPLTERGGDDEPGEGRNDEIVTFRVGGLLPVTFRTFGDVLAHSLVVDVWCPLFKTIRRAEIPADHLSRVERKLERVRLV
jgi:hypothetical protein